MRAQAILPVQRRDGDLHVRNTQVQVAEYAQLAGVDVSRRHVRAQTNVVYSSQSRPSGACCDTQST
jgi:hypothetical protein